jgi:hypothetical protein
VFSSFVLLFLFILLPMMCKRCNDRLPRKKGVLYEEIIKENGE